RVDVAVELDELALALRRRRDVADTPLAEDLFCPRSLHAYSLPRSKRLRIDVDDRVEAGAPHRGSGRREQACRLRGDRPRAVGLGDELCAVAAAEAQERRRAEQLGLADPGAELLESFHRGGQLGAGDDDRDEVAVRWVAELAASLELRVEEARDVVAGG